MPEVRRLTPGPPETDAERRARQLREAQASLAEGGQIQANALRPRPPLAAGTDAIDPTVGPVPDRKTVSDALKRQAFAAGREAGTTRNAPPDPGTIPGPATGRMPAGAASGAAAPEGQGDPRDSADPITLEPDARLQDPGGGSIRFVRKGPGVYVAMDPTRAAETVGGGGGGYMTEAEYRSMMEAKRHGAEVPKAGTESGLSTYIRSGAANRPITSDSRPLSEKIDTMELSPIDLEKPFRRVDRKVTPWGTVSESTSELSGLDQALSRRQWLDQRVEEERGREVGAARQAAEKAVAERTVEEARIDPLAVARIQAQARMGPAYLTGEYATASRHEALRVYNSYAPLILRERELAGSAKTPAERQAHKEKADQLLQMAQDQAALLVGFHPAQFKPDLMAALLASGGLFGGGAPGATAPGGGQ